MKKFAILATLVLAMCIFLVPSICFADVAGSYSLSSIYVTMTEPKFNTVVPTDITTNSRNLKITNIVWTDSTGKTLSNTDKITNAGNTTVKFDIERSAGDRIAARTTVYINNSSEGVERSNVSSDKMTVTKTFSVAGGRLSNASGKGQYLYEENYKPVSTIKATINSPVKGQKLDYDPKMTETEGAIVRGVVWSRYDTTTEKYVEITDKDYLAEESVRYIASILFNFSDGFKLDPETKTGWVNTWNVCEVTNLNGNCCITSLDFYIRPTTGSTASRPSTNSSEGSRPTTGSTAPSSTATLSSIEVTVDELKVGYELPKTFKVKTNLSSDEKTFEVGKEGEVATGKWDSDKNIEANKEYTFTVGVKAGAVSETSDFKVKINGNEVTFTRYGSRTNIEYRFSYTFKAPNEKATGFEPSLKPADASGEKATGFDPSLKESGEKATGFDPMLKESGEKATGFDPTLKESGEKATGFDPSLKQEKIVWAKASSWAIDELNKANEAGLIPMLLNKEDLTKNISRKEFAYIAVKLYEKLTGKKAEAASKNPFTDTKDEEVLKAYKLEITTGTSETTFTPDKEITREQMAAMMQRALKAAGIDTKVDLTKVKEFTDDNLMHNWSRDAIYFMSESGIIKGVDTKENRYGVTGNATREQAILISIRSVEKFAK